MRPPSPKVLVAVAVTCVVIALGALPVLFTAEEGSGADLAWLAQTALLLIAIASLVLAARGALRGRRSDGS